MVDKLKLVVALLCVAIGVWAYYHFSEMEENEAPLTLISIVDFIWFLLIVTHKKSPDRF